jgi:hypothetical protein
MGQRRYGPTLDAGVVIVEKDAERTITPSQLGSTAYTGMLERGAVGELITCTGRRDMLRKAGGYIPDSLLPDAMIDFWDHSNGAGILFLYRVTDGNEIAASLTAYDRKATRSAVAKFEATHPRATNGGGGGWGGRRVNLVVDLAAVPGDITGETTVELPIAFHPIFTDQFKGGQIKFTETGLTYDIVGNDKSDGIAKTELRVATDSKLLTDFGAGTDPEILLTLENVDAWAQEKHLSVKIKDGQINPSTEWGLDVYLNGDLTLTYPDLSSDPLASNYYVEAINEDTSNQILKATDLWTGAITADVRPANHFGTVASATEITAKKLKIGTATVIVDSSLASDNTIAAFTFGADVVPDTYEVEVTGTGPTTWSVISLTNQKTHVFTAPTDGVAYAADNPQSIGFTVTGVTPVIGEKFTLVVLPLEEDELINGKIFFPEVAGAPGSGWFITDNNETEVDITSGDLTIGGTLVGNVKYRLEYMQQLTGGYDGIADVSENDFLPAFDTGSSEFLKLDDQGYGLVKFACPGVTDISGVTSLTVEKAGVNFAEARNHQYRPEVPKNILTDDAAKTFLQDTLGRNDFEAIIFPSWATVADPILDGRLKDVPLTGQVHGREALVARNYEGYHKVAAGIDVTLPRIVRLPIGDRKINGELLNPIGYQTVRKKNGNFVIWGARIPATNQAWKWKQQRELMSYYEHVLQESFPWIIFAINDKQEWPGLIAALKSFFIPEWRKRALRGDTFDQAISIKLDEEINTSLTMAQGDLNCEITLRLADTVERFIIAMGKAGIFEDLAA